MVKRLRLKKANGIKKLSLQPSNTERTDAYPYLRFIRPNEQISRVDRYSIILYWDEMKDDGIPIRLNELVFYPSPFGMEEIEKYSEQDSITGSTQAKWLTWRLDQLKRFGNPWWHHDTKEVLTPSNWILKNPQISSMQEYDQKKYIKPGSELPIVTPIRQKLKPKEETVKKHSLKSKIKRLKLR